MSNVLDIHVQKRDSNKLIISQLIEKREKELLLLKEELKQLQEWERPCEDEGVEFVEFPIHQQAFLSSMIVKELMEEERCQ